MRSSQLLVLPLLALAAAACADGDLTAPAAASRQPLAARGDAGGVTTKLTVPVQFTLRENTCGLTTDVTGEGELRLNFHVTTTGNGAYRAHLVSAVQGTAEGADGSRYRFSYNNNVRLYDFTVAPDAIPAPIGLTASAIDNFHLLGQGGAPNVAVQQRVTVLFDEMGNPTPLKVVIRGDDSCDPI